MSTAGAIAAGLATIYAADQLGKGLGSSKHKAPDHYLNSAIAGAVAVATVYRITDIPSKKKKKKTKQRSTEVTPSRKLEQVQYWTQQQAQQKQQR